MKKERESVKEKNPLAVAAVVALIIAVILLIILADMCFVPSGEIWESIKADYVHSFHPDESPTDSELWKELKEMAVTKADMFPSSFYCWFRLKSIRQEQQEKAVLREEKIAASNLAAEEILTAFEDYLSESDISGFTEADIFSSHKGRITIFLYTSNDCLSCEDESFIETISEITADWDGFAAKVIVRDDKCTAVAFAPEINKFISIGSECPYLNSEGGFDYEQQWGYDSALSQNNFILGLAPHE